MNRRSDTSDPADPSTSALPVRQWLVEYGDQLYAYAVTRVSDASVAEELVQETFVAALKNAGQFTGQAAASTWLIAILRNKIIDHYRRRKRREKHESASELREDGDPPDGPAWRGGWKRWPGDPARSLENAEFWRVFDLCREKLPAHLAETFVLREMEDLATEEVCKILEITPTNLAVRIHRARMLLRNCLENHWFARD